MKMRQSLAQFEADFEQAAQHSVRRREKLRRQAIHRTRARRVERVQKAGTVRFIALCTAILATAVIVTLLMFQALAWIAG